jgi:hypothetical protein
MKMVGSRAFCLSVSAGCLTALSHCAHADPDLDSDFIAPPTAAPIASPVPALAAAPAVASAGTADDAELAALMSGDNEGARDGVARSMKCIDCGMLSATTSCS